MDPTDAQRVSEIEEVEAEMKRLSSEIPALMHLAFLRNSAEAGKRCDEIIERHRELQHRRLRLLNELPRGEPWWEDSDQPMPPEDEKRVRQELLKRLPRQSRAKKGLVKMLRKAKLAKGILLMRAIEPFPIKDPPALFEELGAVHGAVAVTRPENVDIVSVEDTAGTGLRINVRLADIIAHREGRLGPEEYLSRWWTEVPKGGA